MPPWNSAHNIKSSFLCWRSICYYHLLHFSVIPFNALVTLFLVVVVSFSWNICRLSQNHCAAFTILTGYCESSSNQFFSLFFFSLEEKKKKSYQNQITTDLRSTIFLCHPFAQHNTIGVRFWFRFDIVFCKCLASIQKINGITTRW